MQIKIRPGEERRYPVCGFLINGESIEDWLHELDRLGLKLDEVHVYVMPSHTANGIWGCYVEYDGQREVRVEHKHELCVRISPYLVIPDRSELFPPVTDQELKSMLRGLKHICHPAIGLVELENEVRFLNQVVVVPENKVEVTVPEDSVMVHRELLHLYIKPEDPDIAISLIEKKYGTSNRKPIDEPLNVKEKLKLSFYKLMFRPGKENPDGTGQKKPSKIMQALDRLKQGKKDQQSRLTERWLMDMEELEQRNRNEVDKLIDLLANDPLRGLKYALPLDSKGISSGGTPNPGLFVLGALWSKLSPFVGNGSRGGGGNTIYLSGDAYTRLRQQYMQAAEKLVEEGRFEEAAFTYLKLLELPMEAARVLEEGGKYNKAAAIYLKHGRMADAARCYEKGRMYESAISLYRQLGQLEKVGDMYLKLGNNKQAEKFYNDEVKSLVERGKYVEASVLCKTKLGDQLRGQELLLEGWRKQRDGFNCLNYYLAGFSDSHSGLLQEIQRIYKTEIRWSELASHHSEFLRVLQSIYMKDTPVSDDLKELAYGIVANRARFDKEIVSWLKGFNPKDKELMKDAMRYRVSRGR